ncbi:MAG: HAMP domain-containing histidine kinase [Myxococcales bacterium]|nr:HAMP domain-containing histidine kinase [Myxococcales bacterium]
MIRRLLPLLVALGLGALAIFAGLFALHRTFQAERAAAIGESAARRAALEQYARAALARSLAQRLQAVEPRITAAAADPLLPAADLLLWEGDAQRLPRRARPAPGDATPARDLFLALVGDGPLAEPDDEPDDEPWAERLAARAALFSALDAGDAAAIAARFRAVLTSLARYVLPAERDLPYLLALLDRFAAKGRPDPALLRLLLHDGVEDGRGGRVESAQRRLLLRRDALTIKDFDFLVAQVRRLGAAAGVPDADFVARVAEAGPAVPAAVDGPTLLPGGFYAEPRPGGAHGVRVAAGPLLQELTQEMRARGLLSLEDRVDGELLGPVGGLAPRVESPAWARATAAADAAYAQKSILLALCALLVAGVVALALTGQHRKQRYLALKSDFVSAVSHELRTPLASIRLMAETLERRLAGEARARDYPTRIVGAVDGLALMVENILSFNRLDRGRWVARREPVALADVLDRARDKVVPHAARPVRWQVVGAEGVRLQADPELLELLLVNLGRNAVQYTERPEAVITLTATRGRGLRLDVADNGRGMAPGVIKHVFTPFYRAPESAGSRGSGLGLALCQRIMALHRGRLGVTASGPEGTVFTLQFPPEAVL